MTWFSGHVDPFVSVSSFFFAYVNEFHSLYVVLLY
jgi:hypothetical protein